MPLWEDQDNRRVLPGSGHKGCRGAEFTFSAGRGLTNPYKTQGQRPRAKAEGLSWLLELLAVDSVGRARRTVGAPHTEPHAAVSPEGAACPGRGSESALSRELGCRPPRVPSARDGGAGGSGQRGARGEGRGAWGPTAQAVLTLRAAGRAGERPSLCGATFRCARPRGTGGSVGCRESHPGPSWGSDSGRRDPEPLPFGALRRLLGVLCLGWASKKVRRRSWGRGALHGAGTEPGRAFGAWRTRPFGWGRQQLSVAWGCDIRCTSCPAD